MCCPRPLLRNVCPKARLRRRALEYARAPEGRRPAEGAREGARPKARAEGARRRRLPKARARRRPPEGARPKALLSAVFRCLCFCGVFVFLLGCCQSVSAVFCVDAELRCPVLWLCVADVVPCRCVVRCVCFAVCVCFLLCFLYCCCVVCMSAVLVCF